MPRTTSLPFCVAAPVRKGEPSATSATSPTRMVTSSRLAERLSSIKSEIPEGIEPMMGPIATGLGEIYMYTVEAEDGALKEDGTAFTPMDLLTIQEWVIVPQLRNLKGVIEINTIGGYEQQYHVMPYPEQLLAYDMTIADLIEALERNNNNVGAGYIEKYGEQYLVHRIFQYSLHQHCYYFALRLLSNQR